MRDLVTGDCPNRERLLSYNCGSLAVEGREFDFECFPVGLNVTHCADVANFEASAATGSVRTIRSRS
jgi:hypothetical protein